jgi:hypothetical protein
VIGISGHPGAPRELLAAGANVFVPKPVQEPPILAALVRVLTAASRPWNERRRRSLA